MEMLVLVIPLLNLPKLKTKFQSWMNKGAKVKVDPDKCVLCNSHLTLASKSNCDHHFCYYCLASNLTTNPQYQCPICEITLDIDKIKPIRFNESEFVMM